MKKLAIPILISIILLIPTISFGISGDRVSLGYIYNVSSSHTQIVNNANGNINTVSPTCFDLTIYGHLQINDIFSQEFVNEMHEQNILVTPFLSNHWNQQKGKAALANSEMLASEIVEAVNIYNLDGINIDIENLTRGDRDNLTEFVRILKEKMPEGKILSVAVASNIYKLQTSWVSAYDYENLANYADYLVLMAYDEHSTGGPEGPVASINFVEESVKVILENVSRDKVVLGMPLYGRFWKQYPEVSGEEISEEELRSGGEAIVISQIERIISRYKNAVPVYDENTGTVTVTIEVESGDKKAMVNGRYLEEGIYTIYYENENSYMRKLKIMNYYGLKGSALWAIGNEGKGFWDYYRRGFNDDEYESEESKKQRKYYEVVERVMKEYKPMKLEKLVKLDYKLQLELKEKEIYLEDLVYIESKKGHLPEKKKELIHVQKEEPVIIKQKKYKKLEDISISHIKEKRYEK